MIISNGQLSNWGSTNLQIFQYRDIIHQSQRIEHIKFALVSDDQRVAH